MTPNSKTPCPLGEEVSDSILLCQGLTQYPGHRLLILYRIHDSLEGFGMVHGEVRQGFPVEADIFLE